MVWSRHGSSLIVYGYSIWLQIIKLESLGPVVVKLILHPSSSAILGTCLCIPSQLSPAATAGKAYSRIVAAPSTQLLLVGSTQLLLVGLGRGKRADQSEKGCDGLVIFSAPVRQRNLRYKTVGCKDLKKNSLAKPGKDRGANTWLH